MLPIITLGRDSYVHPEYGKTYVPVFEIVGWTDADNPSVDGEGDDDVPFEPAVAEPSKAALPGPGQRAANPIPAGIAPSPGSDAVRAPVNSANAQGAATSRQANRAALSPSDGGRKETRF